MRRAEEQALRFLAEAAATQGENDLAALALRSLEQPTRLGLLVYAIVRAVTEDRQDELGA